MHEISSISIFNDEFVMRNWNGLAQKCNRSAGSNGNSSKNSDSHYDYDFGVYSLWKIPRGSVVLASFQFILKIKHIEIVWNSLFMVIKPI